MWKTQREKNHGRARARRGTMKESAKVHPIAPTSSTHYLTQLILKHSTSLYTFKRTRVTLLHLHSLYFQETNGEHTKLYKLLLADIVLLSPSAEPCLYL